jgi:long-chain acyl-CoA synthetase
MDYKLRDLRFKRFAQSKPTAIALIDANACPWSRGELQSLANQVSHALVAAGLRQGDAVAVVAPNCAEFIAIYFATMQLGLHFVPLNWHLSPAEAAYILADSQAKAVFAHSRYCKFILSALQLEALTSRSLIAIGRPHDSFVTLEQFIDGQSTADIDNPIHGRPMLYTSATTGKPKAVAAPLADAETVIDIGLAYQLRRGVTPENDNVHLCASMLYHVAPLTGVLGSLNMGHKVVLVDRWEPLRFLELIEAHKVTSSFVVPSMFVQLLKLAPEVRAQFDVSSLRSVTHSAAPCPVEIKRQMIAWWGPIIWEMYGATEGGGTSVSSEEWLKYPGTVGRAIAGAQICIFDDQGKELPPGNVGTIYMARATGDTLEYKNDPEKTKAAHLGKYFTVGDLGYLNDDGYLFISDRKIDMIICGGANIYPIEIESQLILHPQVVDCAVFGIPSDAFGEVVHAVVQLSKQSDATAELKHDLLKFLSKHLAAYKLPQSLEFATALPRDPSGKLRKRLLRDSFWKNSGRAI